MNDSIYTLVANMIVAGQHNEILQTHVQAWEDVWANGAIQVEGNTALAKVVYGSLYYILSSLPVSPSKTHTIRVTLSGTLKLGCIHPSFTCTLTWQEKF